MKSERVKRKVVAKSNLVKGPSSSVQTQGAEKQMTREEHIKAMEKQKVLNGRVFDLDFLTYFGMSDLINVFSLQNWGHLFEPPVPYLHEHQVRECYYKMELLEDGGIRTKV